MNKIIKGRFVYMVLIVLLVGTGVTLIVAALNKNINLYLTPSELLEKPTRDLSRMIKVGGLVETHSVTYHKNGVITFKITDGKRDVYVKYLGILPGLFEEKKGVVVEGRWENQQINASLVLAKHDENYTPPKVKA